MAIHRSQLNTVQLKIFSVSNFITLISSGRGVNVFMVIYCQIMNILVCHCLEFGCFTAFIIRGLIFSLFNLFNPTAGGPPSPQVEAIVAEDDGFESADYDYDATDGSISFSQSSGAVAGKTTKDRIEEPKVSLRAFFPETWLFTLDPVNEDSNLSR